MTSLRFAAALALLLGLSNTQPAHAGLNFGWLTASPIGVGENIDLGEGNVGAVLTSDEQTITAELGQFSDATGIRLTAITINNVVNYDYTGTCVPNMVLADGESCTITYEATSDVAGPTDAVVEIGCIPVSAIGSIQIACHSNLPSPTIATLHNLYALFSDTLGDNATAVPALTSGAFTLLCLMILAIGGFAGLRRK